MGIPDEIDRRIRQDPRLRAVMQKIEAGKADFTDTAHYFYRAADIRGEVLSERVLEMPPEARTEACEGVLRKCYTDTCETLDGVQGALDDELGISIAPQHPDYPQERVEQVAQSLADPTVPDETIERRARSATANIAKSFHDAYMKENAGFRSRAGLKCYITRNSGGKCCDWCADLDGRYEYGSEPKDVYARHDNCSCSVTYENGRQRQNVWSKQTWEVPVVGAGAPEPVRYTAATAPQGFAPTVLTNGAKSGTIRASGTGENTGNHWFERIATIDPNDKAAIAKFLRDFEKSYRESDIEHCRVITATGEVYDVHGGKWTVDTSLLGNLMNNSINEHNHVTGESQYSFSWEDLRDSADDGSKFAIAFDEKYRYTMIFPDTPLDSDAVYEAYQKAKDSVGNDLIFNPENIAEGDEQHETIKRACEILGIQYERTTIS